MEGQVEDLGTVVVQEIEDVEKDRRPLLADIQALEELEGRAPFFVDRDNFSVEDSAVYRQFGDCLGDLRKARRKLLRVPGVELHGASVLHRNRAVAVKLQLVNP